MKMFSVLALGVVIGLCPVFCTDAEAQYTRENNRSGEDRICVYKDINYFGAEQCYKAGEEINSLGTQNKSISSIRVYGRATITVYEKTAFAGHSAQFTTDVPDLGKQTMSGNTGWSDQIHSLRVGSSPRSSDRVNSGILRRDTALQPRDGICVYDRPNYGGRSECWNQGESIPDLSREGGWNGQISSIRLFGGRTIAMVFQNTDYRGEALTVNSDIPNLASMTRRRDTGNSRDRQDPLSLRNWDRQISSIQVQSQPR